MDFIRAILFEEPWYLVPPLLVVELVLLRWWATRRTPRARRAAAGGLIVSVALLAMQYVVVTEKEKLIAICRELAFAAEDGDVAAIGEHISNTFQTQRFDRDEFMDHVRSGLTAVDVQSVRLHHFDVTVENGRRAKVTFQATARVHGAAEGLGGSRPSGWELHFEKVGDRWLIDFLSPRAFTPLFPFDSLDELRQAIGA